MSFTFLRWVRFGISASLKGAALPAGSGPRAQVNVQVFLDAQPAAFAAVSMPQARMSVFGPGDVSGVDARQVIRTFPIAGTRDFEPSYRAHVEFDRPDLPWLFTPVGPDANNLLPPWLALIVVKKRDGVRIDPAAPLPLLVIEQGAAAELPALANAAAWAHVQITGALTTNVEAIARNQPERILSRLVCPRVLDPDTPYIACVVPTYNVGVAAGRGLEVANNAALGAAWPTPAPDSISLPIYHHWEFATAGTGDFKSLVTRLQSYASAPGAGTRPLDITTPGFGLTDLPADSQVPLGGALRVNAPDPAPVSEELAQRLLPVVNNLNKVGPPMYGRWHAAATAIARGTGVPGWLDALNLDARHRVAAGLGTRVVQDRQEDLMAAVWQQFGEIIKANQLLRQAQLAIAAAERIVSRNFDSQPDAALLAIAGPALARIRLAPGQTVRRAVTESCLPVSALSGAFRRIARTHGPLERRFAHRARTTITDVVPPAIDLPALIERMASGALQAPRPRLPTGAVPTPEGFLPGGRRAVRPAQADELVNALRELAQRNVAASCTPLDLHTVAQTVRAALVPDVAIPPRVLAQITLPATRVHLSARLDPIMAAPEIPTPMIGPLIELGQDYLLPGLGALPPNSVTIVEPDGEFIEAYFVGLNHEMGRELLWRGFPTDQRGTVFSRFWDRRGAVPGATPLPDADITPIASWQRSEQLGTHLTQGATGLLVLLMRGDLLERYPRATIYLQRAKWKRDNAGAINYVDNVATRIPVPVTTDAEWLQHARFPAFSGRAGSDLMFMGFMVPRAEVRGRDRTGLPAGTPDSQAGWYVVFQEQPTEPRFGNAVVQGGAALPKSEALAETLMRPAFRLFVHASDLTNP